MCKRIGSQSRAAFQQIAALANDNEEIRAGHCRQDAALFNSHTHRLKFTAQTFSHTFSWTLFNMDTLCNFMNLSDGVVKYSSIILSNEHNDHLWII